MPELPEVETISRELNRALRGKIFKSAKVDWTKTIAPLSPAEFNKKIKGQKILGVRRRAKMLILALSSQNYLAVHLKMTGQLIYRPKALPLGEGGEGLIIGGHPEKYGAINLPNKYTRLFFNFSDSSTLFFNDLRKFGWVRWLDQAALDVLTTGHGLEPLETGFTLTTFEQILARYPKRKIKQILLDQKLIAGVGNIYADEAAFAAKVLPSRPAGKLRLGEIKALHRQIIKILKLSISQGGTSARDYRRSDGSRGSFINYLKVYGRAKLKCKRCRQELIKKIKLNGRGTHFCPNCQK